MTWQVTHAKEVIAALKEEEKNALWHAGSRLYSKLEAAESRRLEAQRAAIASSALAAHKRAERLCEEAALTEGKRWRLAMLNGQAFGRRAAFIDSIAARARLDNERVAQVSMHAISTVLPLTSSPLLTFSFLFSPLPRLLRSSRPSGRTRRYSSQAACARRCMRAFRRRRSTASPHKRQRPARSLARPSPARPPP